MEQRLPGHATPQGTRRGAESFGAGARVLGRTGLTVSPVGFGGYRVRDDSALHRRALSDALRGGANLVDTSTNYTGGRSETLVGTIVAHMVQQGELRREQLVVVSKVGYVQGSNLDRVRARAEPYPEMVRYRNDCWHCIHPDFIEAQLDESLARLGLQRLDVLLLHNPEYFLLDAAAGEGIDDVTQKAYDDRILRAFAKLEQLAADGKIGWYGVSSNGFVVDADEPAYTSLARIVELAREVGGDDHRLGVVQMPMNLLELGAALQSHDTADGPRTPLQVATEADLGVLINRPLNAFSPAGALVRLADPPAGAVTGDMAVAHEALARVRKLEGQWATGLGKQLVFEEGGNAVDLFRWGQELAGSIDAITDLEQWQQLRHQMIAPQLGKTSAALLEVLQQPLRDAFGTWWTRYGAALHEAFDAIEAALRSRRRATATRLSEHLDPLLPEPWRSLPLSHKAVLVLLSAPISSVLVGMRQPGYVADILSLRERPVRLLSAATGPVPLRQVAGAMGALFAQDAR